MILAINTTISQFGLALLNTKGEVLGELVVAPGQGRYAGLVPALQSLFDLTGKSYSDLEAAILAIGPGGFTGLRVGMALAKGLAHSLGIHLIGISSLEALAGQIPYPQYQVCPIIHSRRDEVFTALFKWENEKGFDRIAGPTCLRLDSLESFINQPTIFIGHDYQKQATVLKRTLKEKAKLAPPHFWIFKASTVGASGLVKFHQKDFDDLKELAPLYLRPPDIRPNPYSLKSI